jgi:hypothetical protein
MAAVSAALPITPPPVARSRRRVAEQEALGHAAALLREEGLETADADVLLGAEPGGSHVLVAAPVPPATAHVWLLEPLYQRLELAVRDDALLTLERAASAWQFARWTGTGRRRARDEFGYGVREQEYSLVERPTLALDAPVVAAFAEQPGFADVPARQRAMARALGESFVGVFTVRERSADALELEDGRTGRRYTAHEHNPELAYRPGFVALGRLIPFGGGWLRSPAMAFVSPPERGSAAEFARSLTPMVDAMGAGIAIEALITTLATGDGASLPRAVPPAPSRAEATAALFELSVLLRDAGLAKRVPKRKAPPSLVRAAGPGAQLLEFGVDRDVGEWMSSLSEQAGIALPDAGAAGGAPPRRPGRGRPPR